MKSNSFIDFLLVLSGLLAFQIETRSIFKRLGDLMKWGLKQTRSAISYSNLFIKCESIQECFKINP